MNSGWQSLEIVTHFFIVRMKQSIIVLLLTMLCVGNIHSQQRDRRADLNVSCYTNFCVSSNGQLWMSTACGMVYTANGIHSTWRTVLDAGGHFERMAAYGSNTLVAAGFLHGRNYDYVLRTGTGGWRWDTVVIDPRLHWVHACCAHADGRIWLGSASGHSDGLLAYSADSGQTFQVLRTEFDGQTGIHSLYMVSADSGFLGNYFNSIFTTSDNWRTIHRLPTPMDQNLVVERTYMDTWINRIRQWGDRLIVTESQSTFYTSLNGETDWQRLPLGINDSYEVDTLTGALWAVGDSGQLVRLTDWEHVQHYDVRDVRIIGIKDSCAYCVAAAGVLRVSPEGRVDTCGFYTTERPIDEPETTLAHGTLLWGTDHSSVYILDADGWYRVAQPGGRIRSIRPCPDGDDRIVAVLADGSNYTVDTAGRIEPYVLHRPLDAFVKAGLQEMEITTYSAGCFNFAPNTVRYSCRGGMLRESYNDVEPRVHGKRALPVADVEQALLRLGERYSLFPTPQDFGLQDTTVDLRAVFERDNYWCTSSLGYWVVLVNSVGDTLWVTGSVDAGNDVGGTTHFPWLLPMRVVSRETDFSTYQPYLWQTLRGLMPDTMLLRDQLDNSTLRPLRQLQSGDLLFMHGRDGDMDKAIRASTGSYTHVALVVRDSVDRVWIVEAVGDSVRRTILSEWRHNYFDVYRLAVPFDTVAVIARANSFVGQPYDDAFMPDNGKLYCSELIYEAFIDSTGNHLFEAKPMNWRDDKGKLPKYWKKHFRKLGIPVPEGVPGTNPTDLSRSPLLRKL